MDLWPLGAVIDAYQTLGLERRLILSDETLREAFREAGKHAHPDAGGGDGEFAVLREAVAILSSPSQRLRHWLELRGMAVEIRGSIETSLMDLFAEVASITQQAEGLIRKREEAKSALVRAMLEAETQLGREAVERAIAQVDRRIAGEYAVFADFEAVEEPDLTVASMAVRNLAFLEKWRAGLRRAFSRLV